MICAAAGREKVRSVAESYRAAVWEIDNQRIHREGKRRDQKGGVGTPGRHEQPCGRLNLNMNVISDAQQGQ